MKLCAWFLLIFFVLSGCATSSVAKYPNVNYSPTDPSTIQIYSNFPPVAYEVIGEVEADGPREGSISALLTSGNDGIQKKAAQIGGNAVVILSEEHTLSGFVHSPGKIEGETQTTNRIRTNKPENFIGTVGGSTSTSTYNYSSSTSTALYKKHKRGVIIRYK